MVLSYPKPNGTAFAFSRDGKYLASGSEEKVLLFDVTTCQKIKEFAGHTDSLQSFAFTPDGKTLVSSSNDQTIRLWDIASGQQSRQFAINQGIPSAVCVSGCGKYLLVGSNIGWVYIWDLATGNEYKSFEAHKDGIKSLLYLCRYEAFLTGSLDNSLKMWSIKNGELIRSFDGHNGAVFVATVARDAQSMVSGSSDKTMRLWDITTGKEILPTIGHIDTVMALALSPDGSQLISGSLDRSARLWQVASGQQKYAWTSDVEIASVANHAMHNKAFVASNMDILVYDTVSGKQLATWSGHDNQIRAMCFSADGKFLYSAGWDTYVLRWEVATGTVVGRTKTPASIESLLLMNGEQQIACGHWNGFITVWETVDGKQLASWKGHNQVVNGLAVGGDCLVSASEDGQLKLWKTLDGSLLNSLELSPVVRLATLPGKETVAVLTRDAKIELIAVPTLAKVQTLTQISQPYSIAVSGDAQKIYIGNANGTIFIYANK